MTEQLERKLKSLPAKPGCYIFKDEAGEELYVGKAKSLRSRVRSYFQKSTTHTNRIARMVFRVADLETIVVDSELEALILECNLIKRHRPPFNVLLRDDKSYPYVKVTNEPFPRVMFARNPRRDGAKYFGPYTSAYSVRDTIDLLHRIFPLIPCGKPWSGRFERKPCLYYHMGQCLAPCAGRSDRAAYKRIIDQVVRFLSGKETEILDELKADMAKAAENQQYERAAALRDRIATVEKVLERQKVLTENGNDRDVIAVVKDERGAAVQMLYVREGKLIGQQRFLLDGSKETAPSEAVQEFVKQYYEGAREVPREILLPVEIEERRIVQQWLRQKRGAAVTVEVPQKGEKQRLVELAAQNAEEALKLAALEVEQQSQLGEAASLELAEELGLPRPPSRIEGFDISNIQGKAPVGSMVVIKDGEPEKSGYRRFRIRWNQERPNDFAMMREVILRRLRRHLDGDEKFGALPDLIVIDGGKGQLGAALAARDELDVEVPMVGLAKRHELVYVPDKRLKPKLGSAEAKYSYREVVLGLDSPGLTVLRRLRDEAHRFAITFHRKVRDKRLQGSELDEIPGIGPKRRRLLLRSFGSIAAIRRASMDEIAAVPTLTRALATDIIAYLNGD